jgi:hypothetical protein
MKLKLLRWLELGLDFFISTCITLLLLIVVNSIAKVVFKLNLLAVYNIDSNTLLRIVQIFSIFLLLFRDIFKGGSVGKKICGLKIVSENNMKSINLGMKILRNIGILIFPLDVIIFIITGKRLGELITHTTVVNKNLSKYS